MVIAGDERSIDVNLVGDSTAEAVTGEDHFDFCEEIRDTVFRC